MGMFNIENYIIYTSGFLLAICKAQTNKYATN